MIDKIFKCNDCGRADSFTTQANARAAGWAIARDRKTCYCPTCAPLRRNVGKYGGKRLK